MSINVLSDHEDSEPHSRVARGVNALCAAWSQLPPPVKLLAWAGTLALAAPAVRRAKDLGIEPVELLQLAQRT